MLNPKSSVWVPGGFAVIVLALLALVTMRRSGPYNGFEAVQAARSNELEVEWSLLVRSAKLPDLISRSKGQVSAEDWSFLVQNAGSPLPDLRAGAFVAMSRLSLDSPHRDEALRLAKNHLAERFPDGNVGAIQVLKKFGDPAWEDAAREMAAQKDPIAATLGRRLLSTEPIRDGIGSRAKVTEVR